MKITSQDNTYNYFEKEVNHVDIYDSDMVSLDSNVVNGGASFRWSFGPLFAWGSKESTTMLTTHSSLVS